MTESDIGTDSPFSLEAVANTLGWETVCVWGGGLWVGMYMYTLIFCHPFTLTK